MPPSSVSLRRVFEREEAMKSFSTLAILSVTSGRLLTRPDGDGNGIGQMYDLLGYMTGEQPFTHQLPRFAEECKPHLANQFPELDALTSEIVRRCDAGEVHELCDELEAEFGAEQEVQPIPSGEHVSRNPVGELLDKVGAEKVIVVATPESE